MLTHDTEGNLEAWEGGHVGTGPEMLSAQVP